MRTKTMKKIKVILEATLEVPDNVKMGVDMFNIPYYLTMNDLELFPYIAFDDSGVLTSTKDYNCEVLEIDTKIEELNADDIGIS
jgi:hypothetical protein